ncbi:DUF3618 domain-containing protein [Streptomyces sp. CRN 30]|uniref:DUF3618 domain-containing protein n=1 Tax=Streptomyces sp. CRN 30 TaxID=3075613 RepID=UPI002A7EEE85|nr:DUF3618 domain-containing protein [Streptomyces sp. CRN 30]
MTDPKNTDRHGSGAATGTGAKGAGYGGGAVTGAKGPDELRAQFSDPGGRAKARVADLRDKAGAMTVQLRSTAAHAGHSVERGVPGPVRGVLEAGLRHPRPVLLAGAAAGAAVAVGVLRHHRGGRR